MLCRRLDERTPGCTVSRIELASIAALKTYDPPIAALKGERLDRVERRGKYVCMKLATHWLVIHLARGGWISWRPRLTASTGRPGRGPLALRVGLEDGAGFDVTEMGTEKRLAIWVVASPDNIEAVATLGPDPLDPALTTERLGEVLAREKGDLKHAISRQSVIAGIGNAYSDEILHAAKLSPFKPAARLNPAELARLHDALFGITTDALGRAAGLALEDLKDAKRRNMSVHGRAGLPCPVCGDTVQEVSFATRTLQYCPRCQTGGQPLADRRMSRLLR